MSKVNCIAMDTHGKTTDICCKKSVKDVPRRWHVPTTIPALREVIESIPRPRKLTFEEGPLADWLNRELLQKLADQPGMKPAQVQLTALLASYDQAVKCEQSMRRGLAAMSKQQEIIARLMELPGVALIRASTFVAYVDTPWRFASKAALWKYLGIGLVREKSGDGREYLHVELACNHRLKAAMIGAAKSAIEQKDNPFAQQHQNWLAAGISPKNARRNVARSIAAVMWGVWKNGRRDQAERIGVSMSC